VSDKRDTRPTQRLVFDYNILYQRIIRQSLIKINFSIVNFRPLNNINNNIVLDNIIYLQIKIPDMYDRLNN